MKVLVVVVLEELSGFWAELVAWLQPEDGSRWKVSRVAGAERWK